MELRQLRYLVALAQELSFTNAAARINVAQPALSRQIRRLEDELGTALVDRTSRRVQMTAAGRQLVAHAARILDAVEEAQADIRQVTQLTTGQLGIGATQTPGPLDIAQLLSEFHERHPGIDLTVREELSVAVADRLRNDEIDLGLVSNLPDPARRGLELHMVATEPLVLVLPPKHRLSARAEIDFRDLRDEAFVLFPEGATIRTTFDELADAYGIEPHVAFVTTDTDRMREMVSLGLGIGLLPLSDANRAGQPHTTTLIRGQHLTYTVFLARRHGRRQSPAATAMAALIESTVASG